MSDKQVKLKRVTALSETGSKETRWYLPEGTSKELPNAYVVKGYRSWEVWQDNEGVVDEDGDAVESVEITRYFDYYSSLRTKDDAVKLVLAYDDMMERSRKADAEQKEKELAEYEAERQRIENLTASFLQPTDDVCTARKGDMIDIRLSRLSKSNSMGEALDNLGGVTRAKVENILIVSNYTFDSIAKEMYSIPKHISDRLNNTGGDYNDDPLFEGMDIYQIMNNPVYANEWKKGCYSLVTLIMSQNRKVMVVDPQGYDYIRYAGVLA